MNRSPDTGGRAGEEWGASPMGYDIKSRTNLKTLRLDDAGSSLDLVHRRRQHTVSHPREAPGVLEIIRTWRSHDHGWHQRI